MNYAPAVIDPQWVLLEAARLVEASAGDLLAAIDRHRLPLDQMLHASICVDALQDAQSTLQRLAAAYEDKPAAVAAAPA